MVRLRHQLGFSYLALLMIMSVTSIGMAAVGAIWSFESQRQKEKQLHFVGNAYATAIKRYYLSQPNAKRYPKDLNDLIEDKRSGKTKRHLRKRYADPMTYEGEWDVIKQGNRIVGVRSQSQQNIINKRLFKSLASSSEAIKYADLVFAYAPGKLNNNNGNNDTADTQVEHISTNTQTAPEVPPPTAKPPSNPTSSNDDFQLPPRVQQILDDYNAWLENELNRMRDAIKKNQ